MSKQNSHNRGSPNDKLLKSLFRKDRSETLPQDVHSQGKERAYNPKTKRVGYNSSLPKPDPFPNKYQLQALARIAPPKSERKSFTPKALRIEVNHEDSIQKFAEKSDIPFNTNRYQFKPLKYHTSPRSVDDQSPKKEEETVKINHQREIFVQEKREGSTFNVKALLTAEEYSKFGERFPERFKRIGLLGRGGFSVVWLGVHKSSKKRVAVKQILTKNPHETHMKQLWFCSYFFEKGGEAREQFKSCKGISNICRLYTYQIQRQDTWLYYQLCDESLGSSLFQLKGQNINGQRIYRIYYGDLLYIIRNDQDELKKIIIEIAKALTLLNSHNIVHSDLKTENIMLKTRKGEPITHGQGYIRSVKLIDFGSSFLFTNLRQFSMATPEYMPPEILNYILFQNKMEFDKDMLSMMSDYKNPWTIDIWSLGCILLEIVSGVPLWMSAKTKVQNKGMVSGLFAVKNRVFGKIIQKQVDVVEELEYHLREHNYSGIILNEQLTLALKAMLCLEPSKRISPWQLLNLLGEDCQKPTIPSF